MAAPSLGKEELKYVSDCVKSGWVSSKGKYIVDFENSFAKFCGTKYGIATSNGTTAIHLVLAALGIKPGDEVIVPTLTFIATANTILMQKAKPVFADIDEYTFNINPSEIKNKITKKTKAIVTVDLYGHL